MSIKDILLALCVAVLWGINFAFIKLGLEGMPPFLLAAFRFCFIFFPACFFIKPPKIPLSLLVGYGLTTSFGQFALLFYAMKVGMPSGVAAVVIQGQVFFTIILGALFFSEKLKSYQYVGILIAIASMLLLIEGSMEGKNTHIPFLGLLLTILSGLSWAFGNIFNKKILKLAQAPKMSSLLVWGALPPAILFIISSWLMEDHETIMYSISHISMNTIISIIYLVIIASMIGYGIWGMLLGKYPTNFVTPFALIIPVIGLLSGFVLFDETLNMTQLVGVVGIMIGLIFNVFGARLKQRFFPAKA